MAKPHKAVGVMDFTEALAQLGKAEKDLAAAVRALRKAEDELEAARADVPRKQQELTRAHEVLVASTRSMGSPRKPQSKPRSEAAKAQTPARADKPKYSAKAALPMAEAVQ